MAKFVRVNLPVDKPEDTLKLANDIIDWDNDLGAATVLTGFVDMVAFAAKVLDAETKQKAGDKKTATSQKKFLRAAKKCGLAKGQTKDSEGTLLWFVVQVRDVLLGKNHGTEEDLSEFGYPVVITNVGARRNIRIDLPTTPADMLKLAKDIIEEHTSLALTSPLTGEVDMATLGSLATDTETLLGEWAAAKANAQVLHHQVLTILGYAEGQTSDTEGTIYFDICAIRDRLLQKHQSTEEDLSDYGFDVVLSEATVGPKKGQLKPIISEIDVAMGQTGSFQLDGKPIKAERVGTFTATIAAGLLYASATANGLPGVASTITLLIGTPVGRTRTQLESQLGLSDAKPFLKVQNTGTAVGHYKMEFD